MEGLDVVSFFSQKEGTAGIDTLVSTHNGVKYLFSTANNKALFDSNPEKYMPQTGGFCVVAASMGKVEKVDNKHFGVYEGKLYFSTNAKALKMWKKDEKGISEQGQLMWPCLVSKDGRDL